MEDGVPIPKWSSLESLGLWMITKEIGAVKGPLVARSYHCGSRLTALSGRWRKTRPTALFWALLLPGGARTARLTGSALIEGDRVA